MNEKIYITHIFIYNLLINVLFFFFIFFIIYIHFNDKYIIFILIKLIYKFLYMKILFNNDL